MNNPRQSQRGAVGRAAKSAPGRRWRRLAVMLTGIGVVVLLQGCYYMQAITGQVDVLRKRRPVDEVIADASTEQKLRERLEMVQDARQFAVDELLLPENGSYRSYADMQREYVLWNVFAAPEFSLTPKQWCYPVAGCVAYRGYFSEKKAIGHADKLRRDGLDVIVAGVPAYSTLGKFDDPILSTMMRWSDIYLVETLFHELAHQKLYVKGDSAFNESFATAVADAGIARWIAARGLPDPPQSSQLSKSLHRELRELLSKTRKGLGILYASDLGERPMRAQKRQILDSLSANAQAAIDRSTVKIDNWLAAPLNNARLIPLGLYEGRLPAFQVLLAECNNDLECFYAEAARLADLKFKPRQERLKLLKSRSTPLISDRQGPDTPDSPGSRPPASSSPRPEERSRRP